MPGDLAHVEHCTGTALTSFFECEMFPSSISSHDFEFQGAGILAFNEAPASYWGHWDQDDGGNRLLLEYYDGASLEARFDGYAVGDDCFEGVTVFFPPSSCGAVRGQPAVEACAARRPAAGNPQARLR